MEQLFGEYLVKYKKETDVKPVAEGEQPEERNCYHQIPMD